MSANWLQPCFETEDGEQAWCSEHLQQISPRAKTIKNFRSWLVARRAYSPVTKRVNCDRKTRGKAVTLGTILALDLDEELS